MSTIMDRFQSAFQTLAMLAGMQLDLFTPLKDGPMEAKTLADTLGLEPDKLEPLLYSLVTANLLRLENGQFSNGDEAANFLVQGRPEYMGGLGGLYNVFFSAALKTAESIKSGEPKAKTDFRAMSDEELLGYFQKQVHSSIKGGKEIEAKYDFSQFKHLLDAGGGSGGVSIAICEKCPQLKATVADLPKVARLAEHFIAEATMSERITGYGLDLCSTPLPGQYDVAILRALLQTLSQEEALATLKNISQAMMPGGQIFIFGSILENSRLAPPISVTNDLVFISVYDHGRSYTEAEYTDLLIKAGFTDISVEHEALSGGMGLIRAKKY